MRYIPLSSSWEIIPKACSRGWPSDFVRELVAINAFLGTHPLEPGVGRIHQHPEGVTEIATTCEVKSRAALRSHSEWSIVIGSRRMARNAGI